MLSHAISETSRDHSMVLPSRATSRTHTHKKKDYGKAIFRIRRPSFPSANS